MKRFFRTAKRLGIYIAPERLRSKDRNNFFTVDGFIYKPVWSKSLNRIYGTDTADGCAKLCGGGIHAVYIVSQDKRTRAVMHANYLSVRGNGIKAVPNGFLTAVSAFRKNYIFRKFLFGYCFFHIVRRRNDNYITHAFGVDKSGNGLNYQRFSAH